MPVPPPEATDEILLLPTSRIERWLGLARTLPPIIILSLLFGFVIAVILPEQIRTDRELLEAQRKEFIAALRENDVRHAETVALVENRCYGMIAENNRLLQDIRQRVIDMK